MDPVERPASEEQDEAIRSVYRPAVVENDKDEQAPASALTSGRLLLFQYVTMLVSGLILLGLVSTAGYSLLDHWLGEPTEMGVFSTFLYSFHLYLLVSLVLFGGLHLWMRFLVGRAESDDQPPAFRVFLAVFLTILAITIIGSIGTIVYVGADMLLGTGDYSTKSAWLLVLGALQVIVWSALLWWYFKRPRANGMVYVVATGLVCVVVAVLLVIFPVLTKRDAVIDARTSNDLTAITTQISEYAQKNNKLPATLRDLKLDDKVASRTGSYEYQISQTPVQQTDPQLEEDYYYKPSSAFSYKLCAHFKTDTAKSDEDKSAISLLYSPSELSRHPAGRHCFDRTVYGSGSNGGSPEARPAQPMDAASLFSSEG